MEIERKFLVRELPDLSELKSDEITQAYISITPEIRVRKKGEKYYRTEKGEGAMVRTEIEYEISEKDFETGASQSDGRIIEKTRYYIPDSPYTIELDIYHGKHEGLVVCEIEFDTEENANAYTPKPWFGKEITHDISFRNKILASR